MLFFYEGGSMEYNCIQHYKEPYQNHLVHFVLLLRIEMRYGVNEDNGTRKWNKAEPQNHKRHRVIGGIFWQ